MGRFDCNMIGWDYQCLLSRSAISYEFIISFRRGSLGHNGMVVGFTTTYAISAYHH
jgi:hypothetical protein